jgi:hypothetical protein
MRRRRNYQVRPNKAGSAMGVVMGAIFVGIGLFVVIPTFGPFGIFWTLIAAAMTGYNIYIMVSGKGVYNVEMEEETLSGPSSPADASASGRQGIASVEERLQTLQRLYDQRLITREEYDQKRQEILAEKW